MTAQHDKAIEAACAAYDEPIIGRGFNPTHGDHMARAIAAFLRAWEPSAGSWQSIVLWSGNDALDYSPASAMRQAAKITADELEGK